jgi:hypothetical protein
MHNRDESTSTIIIIAIAVWLVVMLLTMPAHAISFTDSMGNIKEAWSVKEPYTPVEKWMLGGVYLTQATDYTSTKDALSRGCVEANKLYGKHPSDGALIAGKVAGSLIVTFIANNTRDHFIRKILLGTAVVIGGGVSYHNYNIECR